MQTSVKVQQILDQERQKAWWSNRSMAALQLWLVGIGCLLVFALLDYWFVFGQSVRIFLFSVLAAVAAWRLVAYFKICNASVSRKQVAGSIEQNAMQDGQSTVVLTTAADEHVRQALKQEPELGQILQERVDDMALQVASSNPLQNERCTVPWRRALFATAAVFTMFAVVGGWWSYSRVLIPWFSMPYTAISLQGPTDRVENLAPFQITGKLRGRKASSAMFYSDHAEQPTQIAVGSDGQFEVNVPGIDQDAMYWVTAGDGTSRRIDVSVFKPVEIAEYKRAF